MAIVVQKYGGSSVADVSKILEVAKKVAQLYREKIQLVVVVSAMGNTTSELIHLAREISPDPDRRELDMLISVGERIAMSLLAMALKDLGVPARSLTGSQSGIITDGAHSNARVVEVRPDRVKQALDDGLVVIVAGFQGVSRNREITTLGRGGSDTTAVVLAAALGADYCEICSDVDGVWSADPRLVQDAEKQDALTLDEALSLARGGAKVLFEDAVRYARDHQVEIRASKTFGPGSGTRLRPGKLDAVGNVAVTGDSQIVRIRIDPSHEERAMRVILAHGVRFRRRVGDVVYGDIRNMHGDLDVFATEFADLEPVGLVQAVGSGLGEAGSRVSSWTRSLRETGIAIRRHGSEGDVAWWEVQLAELDVAVQTLHTLANSKDFKPVDEQC